MRSLPDLIESHPAAEVGGCWACCGLGRRLIVWATCERAGERATLRRITGLKWQPVRTAADLLALPAWWWWPLGLHSMDPFSRPASSP